MSRAGRKRKVKNIYEEPKNVLEMPAPSPFAQLRLGELLDKGIKSVRVGKERVSGKRLKEALMKGTTIKMDGVEIDPQHLPVKPTGQPQDTSTALLRVRARKHITEGNFIAGESLQRIYWAGFGKPNQAADMARIRGGHLRPSAVYLYGITKVCGRGFGEVSEECDEVGLCQRYEYSGP